MKLRLRIALWIVVLVVFTYGMGITGIQLGMIERLIGLVIISVFYWAVAVKWISF